VQLVHKGDPALLHVPAVQLVHKGDPALLHVPAAQDAHASIDELREFGLDLPASQLVHAADTAKKVPEFVRATKIP
jgi:hypothetical protein